MRIRRSCAAQARRAREVNTRSCTPRRARQAQAAESLAEVVEARIILATRTGVHVHQAACSWLIGRVIDQEATFVFVDEPADVPPTPFDMRGAEAPPSRSALRRPVRVSSAGDPSRTRAIVSKRRNA
jgi:hypothetical protein